MVECKDIVLCQLKHQIYDGYRILIRSNASKYCINSPFKLAINWQFSLDLLHNFAFFLTLPLFLFQSVCLFASVVFLYSYRKYNITKILRLMAIDAASNRFDFEHCLFFVNVNLKITMTKNTNEVVCQTH